MNSVFLPPRFQNSRLRLQSNFKASMHDTVATPVSTVSPCHTGKKSRFGRVIAKSSLRIGHLMAQACNALFARARHSTRQDVQIHSNDHVHDSHVYPHPDSCADTVPDSRTCQLMAFLQTGKYADSHGFADLYHTLTAGQRETLKEKAAFVKGLLEFNGSSDIDSDRRLLNALREVAVNGSIDEADPFAGLVFALKCQLEPQFGENAYRLTEVEKSALHLALQMAESGAGCDILTALLQAVPKRSADGFTQTDEFWFDAQESFGVESLRALGVDSLKTLTLSARALHGLKLLFNKEGLTTATRQLAAFRHSANPQDSTRATAVEHRDHLCLHALSRVLDGQSDASTFLVGNRLYDQADRNLIEQRCRKLANWCKRADGPVWRRLFHKTPFVKIRKAMPLQSLLKSDSKDSGQVHRSGASGRTLSRLLKLVGELKSGDSFSLQSGYQAGLSSVGIGGVVNVMSGLTVYAAPNLSAARNRDACMDIGMTECYLQIVLGSSFGLEAEVGATVGIGPTLGMNGVAELQAGVAVRGDAWKYQRSEMKGIAIRIPYERFSGQTDEHLRSSIDSVKASAANLIEGLVTLEPGESVFDLISQTCPAAEVVTVGRNSQRRTDSALSVSAGARIKAASVSAGLGLRLVFNHMWFRKLKHRDTNAEHAKLTKGQSLTAGAAVPVSVALAPHVGMVLPALMMSPQAFAQDERHRAVMRSHDKVSPFSYLQFEFSDIECVRRMLKQISCANDSSTSTVFGPPSSDKPNATDFNVLLNKLTEWQLQEDAYLGKSPTGTNSAENKDTGTNKLQGDLHYAMRFRYKPDKLELLNVLREEVRSLLLFEESNVANSADSRVSLIEEKQKRLQRLAESPDSYDSPVLLRFMRDGYQDVDGIRSVAARRSTVTSVRVNGKVQSDTHVPASNASE